MIVAGGGASSLVQSTSRLRTPQSSGSSGTGTTTIALKRRIAIMRRNYSDHAPMLVLREWFSLFETLYQPSDSSPNDTHQPQKIQVQVTADGKPSPVVMSHGLPNRASRVGGCSRFHVSDSNGYVSVSGMRAPPLHRVSTSVFNTKMAALNRQRSSAALALMQRALTRFIFMEYAELG